MTFSGHDDSTINIVLGLLLLAIILEKLGHWSVRVIESYTDQIGFPLAIHSIHEPIVCCLREKYKKRLKNATFSYPCEWNTR